MTPYSQPYTNVGRKVQGYRVNAKLSHGTLDAIQLIRQDLEAAFPGVFYFSPLESLHITLLDWFDPLYDYAEPLARIYDRLHTDYDTATRSALEHRLPITVEFNELRISPSAIFITGQDAGEFAAVRQGFLAQARLLPGMKPPPQMIHSNIARFKDSVNLVDIAEALQGISIEATELIKSFRLVEEREMPMLDYNLVQEYS